MKVAEKLKIVPKKIERKPKFNALILELNNCKNSYKGEILGRALSQWVVYACNSIPSRVVSYDGKTNPLQFAKEFIDNDFDYTLILMAKTPLLTQETIQSIIDYCSVKEIELCKLPVGYVVDNVAIKTKDINVDSLYTQNLDDFYVVENKKQYIYAEQIWQERINDFHLANGVEIKNVRSVLIGPDVDISEGVVIFSGNVIKGQTVIGKDVILKENNVIENSKISDNCCVCGSIVNQSILLNGVYVSAFCEINNSRIGNESIIGGSSKITNYKVADNSKVASNSVLGDNNVSDSWIGKSR